MERAITEALQRRWELSTGTVPIDSQHLDWSVDTDLAA
jgi:hypothetical protein